MMKNATLQSVILFTLIYFFVLGTLCAQWEFVNEIPTPRGATAVASVNGKIYVMGGTNAPNTSALQVVEIYDPVTNTWETGPEMPVRVMHASAEVVDGKIYLIGGQSYQDGPGLDNIIIFDLNEQTWTVHGGILPHGFILHATTVYNNKIYISGGASSVSIAQNWMYILDPATLTYEKLKNMPSPRGLHESVAVDGQVFIMGGAYLGQGVKSIFVYDLIADDWSLQGNLPGEKAFLGSGVYHQFIYLFAGLTAVQNYEESPGTWRYNTCTKTWEDMNHDYPDYVVHMGKCDFTFENGETYIYTFGGNTKDYYEDTGGPKVSNMVHRYKTSTPTLIPGGAVSGVWTCENSPYVIQEDIQIEKGSTLVIEPCVELIFKDQGSFRRLWPVAC
jgi:N-acetylneuraminic acid mutarotase